MAFETQWLNAHPTDYAFAGGVADVLLAQGDFEAALSRYENFLKRNPDSLPFINNVAWLKAKTGKPGAAALAERGTQTQALYAPAARHLCHRAGRRQAGTTRPSTCNAS